MATIIERTGKTGVKTYYAKVRVKGHKQVSATLRNRTLAKEWASRTEQEIKDGRYFKTAESKRRTLSDLIDRYLETEMPNKAPKTITDQTVQLSWWKSRFGHLRLEDVTTPMLVEARDLLGKEKDEKGKTRGKATVNRYLAALSHPLTVASNEWHWLHENPMKKVSRLKEPDGRDRYLEEKELEKLLSACRENENPYLYPLVILALTTGARKMELLTLKWKQVKWDEKRIEISKTKNHDKKSLPIVGQGVNAISLLKEMKRPDSDYIFPAKNGAQPMEIQKAWYRALEKSKLKNFRFHDLRHTTASYLAMNGESSLVIAKVLGHKSLNMVKRYAHLSTEIAEAALGKLEGKFSPPANTQNGEKEDGE